MTRFPWDRDINVLTSAPERQASTPFWISSSWALEIYKLFRNRENISDLLISTLIPVFFRIHFLNCLRFSKGQLSPPLMQSRRPSGISMEEFISTEGLYINVCYLHTQHSLQRLSYLLKWWTVVPLQDGSSQSWGQQQEAQQEQPRHGGLVRMWGGSSRLGLYS